jgi:anti-sigma B factor antagonist
MEVGGEVDADTSGRLQAAIDAALTLRPKVLEVGLTAVTFLDSSGIRTLMVGHGRAVDQGSALVITDVQGGPRRVLEISGVLDTLTSRPER